MFLSSTPTPFGFSAGRHNRIYVAEANGGGANPGASSVSSYEVTEDGGLAVISESVPTEQTAACWLVLTCNEKIAYTANTPDDSISSFQVGNKGKLFLLNSTAGSPGMGSNPIDLALSRDNRFLYSLNSGNGTIGVFWVNSKSGGLHLLDNVGGLPASANGLAAD
jgi:6-phosphogluconolactonase (cycloisomerase 2 family)